jgi:secreted Zn-dependent insulinase-like peptidase
MKKILTLIVVFWISIVAVTGAQTLAKHPEDQSVSRNLVLENGLKVLLVSDPAF